MEEDWHEEHPDMQSSQMFVIGSRNLPLEQEERQELLSRMNPDSQLQQMLESASKQLSQFDAH